MLQSVTLAGITGRTITTVGTGIGTEIAIEVVATAVSTCGCPSLSGNLLRLIGMWHIARHSLRVSFSKYT